MPKTRVLTGPISGWLSPSGNFSRCGYFEHLDRASRIVRHVGRYRREFEEDRLKYNCNEDTYLRAKGFMSFASRYAIFPSDENGYLEITGVQLQWISERTELFTTEQKKDISDGLLDLERCKRRRRRLGGE